MPSRTPSRHRRHGVLFVHDGDVVEDVFTVLIHPADTIFDNDRQLVGERRVIGSQIRHRKGEHVAIAILVLQSFAGERGAPGGTAKQEATASACRPQPRSGRPRAADQTWSNR